MTVQPALTGDPAQPPPVTVRGVAFEHDCNSLRRRRLSRGLLQAQSRREAAAVLERLLTDLTAPDRGIQKLPADMEAEHAAFAAAVAAEEPPLFFRGGLGQRLQAAESRVQQLIAQMGEAAGGKGTKGGAAAPLPEAVAQALAEHQGGLASLSCVAAAVRCCVDLRGSRGAPQLHACCAVPTFGISRGLVDRIPQCCDFGLGARDSGGPAGVATHTRCMLLKTSQFLPATLSINIHLQIHFRARSW